MDKGGRSAYDIFPVAVLLVVWWVGVWGLLETLLHSYIRGSFVRAIITYGSLIFIVLLIVTINPTYLEFFL